MNKWKKYGKRNLAVLAAIAIGASAMLAGCGSSTGSTESTQNSDTSEVKFDTSAVNLTRTGDYSESDKDGTYDEESATTITLSDSGAEVDGDGATADGNTVTITAAGTYVVSGKVSEGQIVIEAGEEDNVQLVLNGVDITCSEDAPIYVKSAHNTYLTLAKGSENTVVDAREAKSETDTSSEEEENSDVATAAIFAKDDLIINGSGSLTVTGKYNDGISCNDDLELVSGTINVTATDDGVVGKESVSVMEAEVTIEANGDGIKSTKDDDAEKGWVVIDGGKITINAGDDGIHSETLLAVNDGTVTIAESNEGMESLNVVIRDGDVDVTSQDDAINVTDGNGGDQFGGGRMNGGEAPSGEASSGEMPSGEAPSGEMPSGEKPSGEAPNADASGEDSSSKQAPSSDDTNKRGGFGGGKMNGQMGGQMDEAIDGVLLIAGGNVTIDSKGDGLDSNGDIEITGGTVTVYGSENGGNGAIDYAGEMTVDGGTFIAAGMSGMNQAPGGGEQSYIAGATDSAIAAGETVSVKDSSGKEIASITLRRSADYYVISTADVVAGETYTITSGSVSTEVTAGSNSVQ